MSSHRRWTTPACSTLLGIAIALAATGCGIPEDDVPRALGPVLPTPTSAPATPEPESTQEFDVYLVDINGLLSPVPREVPGPGELFIPDLVEQLTAPLSDAEDDQGLVTAVPPETALVSEPPRIGADGIATIDLNAGSLDSLTGNTLSLALAQIVYTFTESASIDGVVILIEGESRPWPTSAGDVDGALTREAFLTFAPGFVAPTPAPTPTPPPEQQGGGRGNGGGQGGGD